jgi:hypothetical protein
VQIFYTYTTSRKFKYISPSFVDSCHDGMARPRDADGGDGLQIWKVAAIILNKQPRTAD